MKRDKQESKIIKWGKEPLDYIPEKPKKLSESERIYEEAFEEEKGCEDGEKSRKR